MENDNNGTVSNSYQNYKLYKNKEVKMNCNFCDTKLEGDNMYEVEGVMMCADCFDERTLICED